MIAACSTSLAQNAAIAAPTPPQWPLVEDADQDGLRDADEILLWFNPFDASDGLSDIDADGLSLAWEFQLGTAPDRADTDFDGWTDSDEVLIFGTNPLEGLAALQNPQPLQVQPLASAPTSNSTAATPVPPPTPSLSNGDFSAITIAKWTTPLIYTKSYQGNSFEWGEGKATAWTAYRGDTIEVWKAGGGTFVELDGNKSSYGIKQSIANVRAGGFVIAWKQSGRNDAPSKTDAYCVRVYYLDAQEKEVVISESPTYQGFDKMKWTDNAHAFTISNAHISAAAANPIYIAFIPQDLNTFGTLVDDVSLLPVEFMADNEDDGDIDSEDDEVEETRRLVIPLKLNKPDEQSVRKLKLQLKPITGMTVKIKKTGDGKVRAKDASGGVILLGENASESIDLTPLLSNGETMIDVTGFKNGNALLTLELITLNQKIVADKIAVRVCNADIIFRRGDEKLASIMNSTFTHGGVDTGDDQIYDTAEAGVSAGVGQTSAAFYSSATPGFKKRTTFNLKNYMAGRILEKLHDNLRAGKFDNPTAVKKWNLFTTSENYQTSNCLEWIHHQWIRAVGEVYTELSKATQRTRFEQEYYTVSSAIKNLVEGTLVKTPVTGPVGIAEAYVLALISGVNFMLGDGKAVWDNKFEGQWYYYYPGYYDIPEGEIPWWVPPKLDLYSEGRLQTVTPKSYDESLRFKEVTF